MTGPAVDWPADGLEPVPACPLCGGIDRVTLLRDLRDGLYGAPGRWELHRCVTCTCAYLDPRPTQATLPLAYASYLYLTHQPPLEQTVPVARIARFRRTVRNGYLNRKWGYGLAPATRLGPVILAPAPVHRRVARLAVRDLPYVRPEPTLLDLGCGNGTFLVQAETAGWRAEGIDPDPASVAEARGRGLTAHLGTLDDHPLIPESFDAVTLSHVIEHLVDPVATLAECRRLLRPGGLLWIATPNLASPGYRQYGRDWLGVDAPRHLVLFTPESLRRTFEQAGFDLELLPPSRARWMFEGSEAIRQRRTGQGNPRGWRLRALEFAVHDLRALRNRGAGEELIALGRPIG